MSSNKEEIDEITGDIRYIKFSGYYDKFYEWEEKPRQLQYTREFLSI